MAKRNYKLLLIFENFDPSKLTQAIRHVSPKTNEIVEFLVVPSMFLPMPQPALVNFGKTRNALALVPSSLAAVESSYSLSSASEALASIFSAESA